MGKYSDGLQRSLDREDLSLKASGTESATTTGTAQELGDAKAMTLALVITATNGSPTMQVDIEGSDDNVTYHVIGTFGANGFRCGQVGTSTDFTTTATKYGTMPAARWVRYKSTIGGTGSPSFTYSIGGTRT